MYKSGKQWIYSGITALTIAGISTTSGELINEKVANAAEFVVQATSSLFADTAKCQLRITNRNFPQLIIQLLLFDLKPQVNHY